MLGILVFSGYSIDVEVSLMIEGQNGLTWDRWIHILALAERLKFPSVFRSFDSLSTIIPSKFWMVL